MCLIQLWFYHHFQSQFYVLQYLYQEQDRLNVDYDELTGSFSQGSVMTNRKLGETVGGMGIRKHHDDAVTPCICLAALVIPRHGVLLEEVDRFAPS